jgi:alkanesulfonate monooxygenase SsuD/methylene tetrahydromethanopterin reductase-like flavin-dependent oxidoreductase (luciferase family)
MRLGVCLPNTLMPQADRQLMLDWARHAEELNFSSLGTIDQPGYDSWDPLISLTAAAAVTERINLVTCILQLPNRNEVLVAKQVACLDLLSNGRVRLGIAAGGRESDFDVLGASFHDRGKRFSKQVARLREIWTDARQSTVEHGVTGPAPVQTPGVPLWLGGMTEQTIGRALQLGDGFIFAAGGPELMTQFTPGLRQGATAAGKPNYTIAGLAYGAMGNDARVALERGAQQALRYYGQLWKPAEEIIHHGPPEKVAEDLKLYEASGIDELIISLEIPELDQLDQLARAREIAGL